MTTTKTKIEEIIADIQSSNDVKKSMASIIAQYAKENNIPLQDIKLQETAPADFVGIPISI